MNKTRFLMAAGLMCQATLFAQSAFQPAGRLSAGRGGRGVLAPLPRAESGRPFSAVATALSVQTLATGTRIREMAVMVEYRDAEGRVRTELGPSADKVTMLIIRDPVAGVSYQLDSAKKTAVKITNVGGAGRGGGGRGGRGAQPDAEEAMAQLSAAVTQLAARKDPNTIIEDLGTVNINGVPARGTRTTTIVPAEAIGNDTEFRSVDERWFSPDLNLLVKSVSTDPRFGTSTYELTNISRRPPDPALFRVPADYTIIDEKQ